MRGIEGTSTFSQQFLPLHLLPLQNQKYIIQDHDSSPPMLPCTWSGRCQASWWWAKLVNLGLSLGWTCEKYAVTSACSGRSGRRAGGCGGRHLPVDRKSGICFYFSVTVDVQLLIALVSGIHSRHAYMDMAIEVCFASK